MKKKNIILVCCIFALTTISAFAFKEINIRIGEDMVEFNQPILNKNNCVFVPVREFCEAINIPVNWDEENKEVHIDIFNKQVRVSEKTHLKKEGVIPDKETAYAVGKLILETYIGKSLEYQTDTHVFYLDTRYLEEENAWQVIQVFKFNNNAGGGINMWTESDFINVKINKNTGEIMFINTYGIYDR